MRNSLFISTLLCVLPLLASAQSLEQTSICENKAALRSLKQQNIFQPLTKVQSQLQNTSLVALAELHFTGNKSRADFIRLFADINKGKKLCLFYELRSEKSIDAHIKKFRALQQEGRGDYSFNIKQFESMTAAAKSLQMKEITVDSSAEDEFENPSLNLRNQAMSENIRKSFSAGLCERGLFFVGKSHLVRELADDRPIQVTLRGFGIKTLALNFQQTNETQDLGPESFSWNGLCSKQRSLHQAHGLEYFEHRLLPRELLLNPLSQTSGRWSDLDGSILFSE